MWMDYYRSALGDYRRRDAMSRKTLTQDNKYLKEINKQIIEIVKKKTLFASHSGLEQRTINFFTRLQKRWIIH